MNRSRTLAPPTTWLSTPEADSSSALARSADERVTTYFHDHADAVYRYLSGVYGSPHDAEEVTQEAFLRLYQALAAQESIERPRAWVFTVARRLMINRRKHGLVEMGGRHAGPPVVIDTLCDPAPTPEDHLARRRRRVALKGAMQDLTAMERQCLCARAQGLKLREIGSIVGLDLRRVAEIIDGAVERLQRHLRG
jgi:RNA polymerase sigma-70 factor (ECF subfamily)